MREKHGALLDSEILADVYLELTGGRQKGFGLDDSDTTDATRRPEPTWRPNQRPAPLTSRLTQDEAAAHSAFVAEMGDAAVWAKYD